MALIVYLDETGSVGRGARKQPLLTLVGILVHEDKVQPLAKSLRDVAWQHLGWLPGDFELHGHEIWHGTGHWTGKQPAELLAAYEDAITALDTHDLDVAWASIHKARLNNRYGGSADRNAYLLALQFFLEKIDALGRDNKILVADEAKEHQLRAINMVADLQEWGLGEVPGRHLRTVIDSMHFVSSHASPGVQLADLCAYALQRSWSGRDQHPEARMGLGRVVAVINEHARTWREPWPAEQFV